MSVCVRVCVCVREEKVYCFMALEYIFLYIFIDWG